MSTNRMRARRFTRTVAAIATLSLTSVTGIGHAADSSPPADLDAIQATGEVAVNIAERDKIFNAIKALQIPGLDGYSVGLNPNDNTIKVDIFAPDGLPSPVSEKLKFGDNVLVSVTKDAVPASTGGAAPGGIPVNFGKGECTLGFAVSLKGGRSGFLTAGHCFAWDKPADQTKGKAGDLSLTGVTFNTGPSDWGIVSVDGDDASQPWLRFDDKHNLSVTGIAEPKIGMEVCKQGRTTGLNCGEITLLETIVVMTVVKDPLGNVIRPGSTTQAVAADYCSEPGDSGGPVYFHPDFDQPEIMAVGGHSASKLTMRNGKAVCLEKVGKPNVSYFVPMSDTPVTSTNPSDEFSLKVASAEDAVVLNP